MSPDVLSSNSSLDGDNASSGIYSKKSIINGYN
jgi:hypothetical protein